ncbi:transmembrane protein 88 [Sphaerodactylus townsendi]|uniref:transmembrane protein 88 n=1 Tax=Sphaerodactylus townsendi TaxID=933632 RepID=UPI0020276343|nr:transmembrane protein 88 [Sphaerodactylus townsendi]
MGLDNRCQRTMSGSSDPESGTGASPLPPPPYAGEGALELRGSLDCWACAVLVTLQNLLVGTLNLLLVALIFGIILFPSGVLLGFGFLCHSKFFNTQAQYCTAHLHDTGSVALLVVGFTLLVPLLVLALAAYCRVARRLQLGYCLIPYSKAVYKNMPVSRYHSSSCCCTQDLDSVEKVWV